MQKADNTRNFLEMVEDAACAIRIGGRKAGENFAAALKSAQVNTATMVEMPLSGGNVMLSAADPSVLSQLREIAAGIKDATIEPRVSLNDVLALHGQGEVCDLEDGDGRASEAIVLEDEASRTVRAEFVIDPGFRSSFRTVVNVGGIDEDGRAIPITYWVNQYKWNEGKLTLESSKEFPRNFHGGAKRGVAEYKICGGMSLAELLEEYDERDREGESSRREDAIRTIMRHLKFLTGLVLSEAARLYGDREQRQSFGRGGFSFVDHLSGSIG